MKIMITYLILFFSLLACNTINDSLLSPTDQTDTTESNHIRYSEGTGIMVNIAADALGNYPPWGKNIDLLTKEQINLALNSFVDSYSNTQVTTLVFNVNYQRSCFKNKIMETYWDINDPEKNIKNWPKFHWQIFKKGIDPYETTIARCKLKNISPWISVRMNDHHYFNDSLMINKFWLNNPQYRRHPVALFDYSHKEVRDYFKAYIKEVLDKYDIDGIELDWMRTYTIFKNVNDSRGILLINNYMKEIKELVNTKALERGHPIKIAVRVPPKPIMGISVGLDAVSWVKNGSVDIIIPTNWFQPTNFDIPIELWKKEIGLGKAYQIIPGADAAFMIASNINLKGMQNNVESMRGFSISAYSRGADAVYLFNNFLPTYKRKLISKEGKITIRDDKPLILSEIGKFASAINKPRTHVLTFPDPDIAGKPTSAISLPNKIEKYFSIHSGPKPTNGNYIIRVGLDASNSIKEANLEVKLNNIPCVQIEDVVKDPTYQYDNKKSWDIVTDVSETSARVLQFKVDLKSIRNGYNLISIINSQNEVQKMTWLEIYIDN